MEITFVKESGSLREALGVDIELMAEIDSFTNNIILSEGSLLDIVKGVLGNFDLTDNQAAAFFYALGYFDAKRNG